MGFLAGRIAIVTGSGQGVGRGIALALAEQGASLMLAGRTLSKVEAVAAEIQAAGGTARAILCDVKQPDQIAATVQATLDAYGGIDILVNNAAVRKEAPITEVSFADWKDVLGIMLDGAFLCTKACVPSMKARGGGSIIMIGGMTGHSGAMHRVHVVTGKAGLAGLTKAVALDVAEYGITANCVVPGLIGTARGSHSPTNPNHHANRAMPLGRRGTAQEVAGLVRYLAGPQARYVTGQSWHLNGGSYMA